LHTATAYCNSALQQYTATAHYSKTTENGHLFSGANRGESRQGYLLHARCVSLVSVFSGAIFAALPFLLREFTRPHCKTLQSRILGRSALPFAEKYAATRCNTLQHIAKRSDMLLYFTSRRQTLSFGGKTHCDTATRCNTLQYLILRRPALTFAVSWCFWILVLHACM